MSLRLIGVGVLAWASLVGSVRASLVYQYAFDQSAYTVAPGGSVTVRVFLQETVSGGDTSRLATVGLVGAGVRLRFDVAPLPSSPARVLTTAAIAPNTGAFDDPFGPVVGLVSGSYAQFTEAVDLTSPAVLGVASGSNTYRILLGSFRLTAGTIAGQATTIRAMDIPSSSDTITGAGLVLDSLIGSSDATVRVDAVPEPAGIMLLSTGALGLLAFARRRRRVPRGMRSIGRAGGSEGARLASIRPAATSEAMDVIMSDV